MRLIVAIFFLPIVAIAQEVVPFVVVDHSTISPYLNAYSQAEGGAIRNTQDVENFISKIASKRGCFKTEKDYLKYIFTKTHHRFLRHYEEYASFNDLLTSRSYNCLTGTALYALILKDLNVPYEIFETNYHIFLLAQTSAGNVLFEATDPLKGFISNDVEIDGRIKIYKQNSLLQASNTDKTLYRFKVDLYNRITLEGIIGLLHYNLAVDAFNRQDLQTSIFHLDKAILLYQSSRIEEFSKIILLSVMESKLDRSEKETCLRKIQSIRQHKMPAVASSQSHQ
jgi:hypothetical protein